MVMPAPGMQPDMNWFGVLAHHAGRTPDKAITVFEGETLTYGGMARRAEALAGGLAERGVGAGAVVAILSYNCPEILETIFAANFLGAIAMPINWRLAGPEVRYILEHSGARALVCDEPLVELADEATTDMEAAPLRACVTSGDPASGWTALDELRSSAHRDVHVRHHRPAQRGDAHPHQSGLEEPGPPD
jgi:fatty-acyl-CoA synthase